MLNIQCGCSVMWLRFFVLTLRWSNKTVVYNILSFCGLEFAKWMKLVSLPMSGAKVLMKRTRVGSEKSKLVCCDHWFFNKMTTIPAQINKITMAYYQEITNEWTCVLILKYLYLEARKHRFLTKQTSPKPTVAPSKSRFNTPTLASCQNVLSRKSLKIMV